MLRQELTTQVKLLARWGWTISQVAEVLGLSHKLVIELACE